MRMVVVSPCNSNLYGKLSNAKHFSDINEAKVVAAANQFVSLGLKAAGYQYVNIDVGHHAH